VKKILFSWVGYADCSAAANPDELALGPIAQALKERVFDEVVLLNNYPPEEAAGYFNWLRRRTSSRVLTVQIDLSKPTDYEGIYRATVDVVRDTTTRYGEAESQLTYHLSPGTPAMAAVWIILAKTRFPAELIESSKQHGVCTVSFPFDLAADFLPEIIRRRDERLIRLSSASSPDAPEFSEIIYCSEEMRRVIILSQRVAARSIPVLIEGETGTGKELLAKAIWKSSLRKDKPFKALNCAAMPSDLVESLLFGTGERSFTGVGKNVGYFEACHGGTLFLDEIGDLSLNAQAKVLRALQEKQIVRLGETTSRNADVRIVAATHRTLMNEVAEGNFREDLFYRLAVAIIKVPALRERTGDTSLLVQTFLERINRERVKELGCPDKDLSVKARNLLLNHSWPGNVRELLNTLVRAAEFSDDSLVTEEDIRASILVHPTSRVSEILNMPFSKGFSLPRILKRVAQHYIGRALDQTSENKTQAAEILGLPSYQTLSNWMTKYGINR